MIGEPALPSVAGLGLEPVDEIDHIVEPAAGAGANTASSDGDGKMRFASAGPADQHGIALLAMKPPPARSLTSVWLIGVPQTGSLRGPWQAAAWQW